MMNSSGAPGPSSKGKPQSQTAEQDTTVINRKSRDGSNPMTKAEIITKAIARKEETGATTSIPL